LAGFYLNQIYFERLLIKTANIMGVKTLYEIRNGGMIESYNSGGGIYRHFMKNTLIKSSLVLCQGYDYVVFMKEEFNRESVYYPNYIMDDFVSDNNNGRETQAKLRLIYFGRVVPDKNIEFILFTIKRLKELNVDFSLDIIGGYEDVYYQKLMKIITDNDINKKDVLFHGQMNFAEIHAYLKKAHFFIFPSKEKREGHSNALTEAMGSGVVPIVSTAGFNSSIVNNPSLVISEWEPLLYATAINDIYRSNTWKQFSDEVYKRVVENFTELVVKNSLLTAYDDLYKK
jgi:glycosyltransferase involved in cell wall biosynthesis